MALVDLSLIVRKLHRATNIYDAATEILKASMQAVHDVVAESRYNTGRIQRSILHLRPDGSYRSIAVLEEGENYAHSPSDPSFLFSATAWKVLCAYRQAIAIDVQLGQMSILQTDTYLEVSAAKYKFDGKTTQNLMQRRNTTHVLVVPLFDMGAKSILGMLSIEVQCPRAVGRKYVWLECLEKLELLLMTGGPYLERLPDHLAEPPDDGKFRISFASTCYWPKNEFHCALPKCVCKAAGNHFVDGGYWYWQIAPSPMVSCCLS